MKRVIMMLTVVLVMATMMVAMAMPAFAHDAWCTGKGIEATTFPVGTNGDTDQDGRICFQPKKGIYKDDHGFGGH